MISIRKIVFKEAYFIFILIVAALLRIYHITFQSLWLDEIHTMHEANPSLSLMEIVSIIAKIDPHPPLYFFSIHYWFKIFGYNELSARIFSAMIGIAGVAATYFLTIKISNSKNIALLAMFLVAINPFHIAYSQEVRDYSLLYLTSTLSFLYFLKYISENSNKVKIGYVVCTILMIYTHYFGVYLFISQIIAYFFLNLVIEQKWNHIKKYTLSCFIIGLCYLPWIPIIIDDLKTKKEFWIQRPETDFFIQFYQEYFGNFAPLYVLASLLIILFLFSIFIPQLNGKKLAGESNLIIILFIWILVAFGIPYIQSVTSTPILISRYTIGVLPAIVVFIAIGINTIETRSYKLLTIFTFTIFSFIHLFAENKYYTQKSKQQFREITQLVVNSNKSLPHIYSDKNWYFQYYFNHYNTGITVHEALSEKELDDILTDSTVAGLWLLQAHNGVPYAPGVIEKLNAELSLETDTIMFGAWAKYYTKNSGQKITFNFNNFTCGNFLPDGAFAMWCGGEIKSNTLAIEKGNYVFLLECGGTIADGQGPLIEIKLNNKTINQVQVDNTNLKKYFINYTFETDFNGTISINFANDMIGADGVDRNAHIKSLKLDRK